ncbi:DUF4342 domain-containing protein [Desulfofalx alkaliphila]|uniref:DUF4342 domain-containing protein n=1 Tax=Desulfofalx alkaliphila TaxID=105483 RepID=UPI0004E1D2A2|nr:DUF4342 domain-containing protein [Desulfofalx alkaliphila]
MTSELEKIDLIRARLGVSYKQAKDALENAGGDVVEALVKLEEKDMHLGQKIQGQGMEVMGQLRSIINKGHKTKVKIKKEGRTVCEFPATIGALGLLGALYNNELALIGVMGTVTALANNYSIEIERPAESVKDCDYPGYGMY